MIPVLIGALEDVTRRFNNCIENNVDKNNYIINFKNNDNYLSSSKNGWLFGRVHQNMEQAGLDGRKAHSSHSEKRDKKTITIKDRELIQIPIENCWGVSEQTK